MKKTYYSNLYGLQRGFKIMRITILLCLVSIIQVYAVPSIGQVKLDLKMKNTTIEEVLQKMEESTNFRFFYQSKDLNNKELISVDYEQKTVIDILDEVLPPMKLNYEVFDNYIAIRSANDKNVKSGFGFDQKAVSGKVTDSSGVPLPGVTVIVKGTTKGTVTNAEGEYYLNNISDDAIIQFSFIGMKTQEMPVAGKSKIDMSMVTDAIGIDEVVAIGYGTMKKSDLTGSISSVKADELEAFPTSDVAQAMQGRAAGVQVTSENGEPGAGLKVRVRGGTSIGAGSDPLYVVDGFAGGAVPPAEDIASIEILKDASATAIYGSRGANGVILITTKSGKTGETIIEVNSSYSFDNVAKTIDLLNATEFAEYINEIRPDTYPNPSSYGEGTDWQDIVFRTGSTQNHKISASGGKENFRFYSSLSYFDQEGIIINSNYKHYTGLLNLDFDAGKNVKVGTRMYFYRSSKDGVKTQESSGGGSNTGVVSGALIMEPTLGIYDEEGKYTTSDIGDPNDNPYAVAKEYTDQSVGDVFQGNGYVEWTIIDDLVFKTTFGTNVYNGRSGSYSPTTLQGGAAVGGQAAVSSFRTTSVISENYLSYNKTLNEVHNFIALAGYSYQSHRSESFGTGTNGYLNDSFLYWDLGGGSDPRPDRSSLRESEMASFYGRLNYNYNDKYLLTFTGRRDGCSKFGANTKWGFFPSGAFAWNVKNEPFLQNVNKLSQLKFRASYGVTGNADIGEYRSLASLEPRTAVINEQRVNAIAPDPWGGVANGNLSWESTKQTDIGIDIGFWNNRVALTADYYYMKTEDLLYNVPIVEYSGYREFLTNLGSNENKGFEFALNTVNFERATFNWNTNFNISFNRNKVLSIPGGDLIESRRPGHIVGDDTNILKEGSPVGSFYGYIYDGVNPDDGSPVYRDIAGRDGEGNLVMEPDGVVDSDDRTIIGNPHPDFIFGFTNDFSYKNFDLSIFFQGVVGNDMYNFTRMELEWCSGKGNQMATVLNRWTPTNRDTDIPVASGSYSSVSSTRWIEKGSYLRLKNISLGYNLPKSMLERTFIRNLRIYASAQNLFTITDYTGYNPDVSYRDSNTSLGLDYGSYPNTRSFTLGVNIKF